MVMRMKGEEQGWGSAPHTMGLPLCTPSLANFKLCTTFSWGEFLIWNMASPALAGLIVEFFYTGSSVLCALFLEMFSREVPKTVVCLAATAVCSNLFT